MAAVGHDQHVGGEGTLARAQQQASCARDARGPQPRDGMNKAAVMAGVLGMRARPLVERRTHVRCDKGIRTAHTPLSPAAQGRRTGARSSRGDQATAAVAAEA